MTYTLSTVLEPELHILIPNTAHHNIISSVTADSRKVQKDSLFVAVLGNKNDGFQYIDKAISAGASVIMCHINHPYKEMVPKYPNILFIPVPYPRYHLSRILAKINNPLSEYMAAVTGTNGKTSVADFARQILAMHNVRAASIGTLGIVTPDTVIHHGQTTPDPEILYPALKKLKTDHNIDHIIFEASSHGLEQFRLHGLSFKTSAFTNFSRDHLDYHASEDAYYEAKQLLFDDLTDSNGCVYYYADDNRSNDVLNACQRAQIPTVSIGQNADISIDKLIPHMAGQTAYITYNKKEYVIEIPLCGSFQVINALCAAGLAATLTDCDIAEYFSSLEKLKTVDGRMDYIGIHKEAAIYVDYAHTPDALEKAILALREHCSGRLITLFGCGGDRDKTKRPLMGEISERLADITIITDDNPRTEDPDNIHQDILKGCKNAKNITLIPSRREAITKALDILQKNDILLIAGKGHENGQTIGTTTYPFKDAVVVSELM